MIRFLYITSVARRFAPVFFALCLSALPDSGAARDAVSQLLLITRLTDGGEAHSHGLDRTALEALPQHSFVTSTIWTDAPQAYSGPSLRDVLASKGVTEGTVFLTAANQYRVEIPWDHIEDEAPIIATRIDGEPFSRRAKGPLWVVFPYDADSRYRNETIYALSIWQITAIDVRP